MKIVRIFFFTLVFIFAGIGFLFTSVFVAMQFGWLNVRGSIDARNNSIISIGSSGSSPVKDSCTDGSLSCSWANTAEWETVAGGLAKDHVVIERVSSETGVPARLIASVVVPEQIRFFTANREVFKRYFEPLKILGSLSQFSLGVSGIKQDTAEAIEKYAADPASPFYPGDGYAELIAYDEGLDESDALFNRLTDEKNHYYSYLYTAVFIKEIMAQWERAGYSLSDKPEIVATLFNIGFNGSRPNVNPQTGGAPVTVGGFEYTFGALAGLFYRSSELPTL